MNWSDPGVIGVVVALVPIIWSSIQYIQIKKSEEKKNTFEVYHKLIKALVQPDSDDGQMSLDRQIAIVFELRNFSGYYPVTLRILKGLKESWTDSRIISELSLSISYIEKKNSNFFRKIFN